MALGDTTVGSTPSKPTRRLRDLRIWSRRNLPIRPPEKLTHFWPPAAGRTCGALLVRPYPLRAAVCGLLGAVSVTVNVPGACPTRIALKRTTIEHCPPAASELMHPLLVMKNWVSGVVCTVVMSMELVPPLVRVKVALLPKLPGNPVKYAPWGRSVT